MPPIEGTLESTPKPDAAPAAAAAPSFVPSEDFKRFEATMTQTLQTIQAGLHALAASRPAPAAVVEEAELTDEQLQTAIAEGNVGAIRGLVDRAVNKVRKEEIEPMRNTGTASLSNLTFEVVKPTLTHYPRFKAEIDQAVADLPVNLRMNPDIIRETHNLIVGRHAADLVKEGVETALRQAAAGGETPGSNVPGAAAGRGVASKIPNVEELLGKDAADALVGMGRSPDEHARKLGHKDWPTYATFVQKQQQEVAA